MHGSSHLIWAVVSCCTKIVISEEMGSEGTTDRKRAALAAAIVSSETVRKADGPHLCCQSIVMRPFEQD